MRHFRIVWATLLTLLALGVSPLHAQPVPDSCRLLFGGTPDAHNRHRLIIEQDNLVQCTTSPVLPGEDPPAGRAPHIVKAWNCVAKPNAGAQFVYDLLYPDLYSQQQIVSGQSDGGVMFRPIPDAGISQCMWTYASDTVGMSSPDPCALPYVLKFTTCGGVGTKRCTGDNRNWCFNSNH